MAKVHEIIEALREDGLETEPSGIWVSTDTTRCDLCGAWIDHADRLFVVDSRLGGRFSFKICVNRPECRQRAEKRTWTLSAESVAKLEETVVL